MCYIVYVKVFNHSCIFFYISTMSKISQDKSSFFRALSRSRLKYDIIRSLRNVVIYMLYTDTVA